MKKKKMIGLLGLFLLGVYFINLGITKASPDSIVPSVEGTLNYLTIVDSGGGTLGGAWDKLNYNGSPLYCVDNSKSWPISGITYNKTESKDDKGLVYILENGYTGGSSAPMTGDVDKDRYITQGAIWLYYNNGSLGNSFDNADDPDGLKTHMRRLYSDAVAVKNGTKSYASTTSVSVSFDSPNTKMTLSGENYTSEVITPTVTKASNYTVTVSGAAGAKVLDVSGAEKSTFASGSGFVVSVPKASVTDTSSVDVTVSATGDVSYVNIYTPDPSVANSTNYQKILIVDTKETTVSESLALSATAEKVCVNYVIVGDVIPDPKLTDPTPDSSCYDKGHNYDQEKKLTTRTNCTFKGWNLTRDLTGEWVDGTALNEDLTLYGAWDCPTVTVPSTASSTPLIILGVGLVSISAGTMFYLVKEKKSLKNNK